jgi:hypothetical protein
MEIAEATRIKACLHHFPIWSPGKDKFINEQGRGIAFAIWPSLTLLEGMEFCLEVEEKERALENFATIFFSQRALNFRFRTLSKFTAIKGQPCARIARSC